MTHNTARPARTRRFITAVAATGAILGSGLGITALAAPASASPGGLYVQSYAGPGTNYKTEGYVYANCSSIGHAPSVRAAGGVWYRVGTHQWIFNNASTPFCY